MVIRRVSTIVPMTSATFPSTIGVPHVEGWAGLGWAGLGWAGSRGKDHKKNRAKR